MNSKNGVNLALTLLNSSFLIYNEINLKPAQLIKISVINLPRVVAEAVDVN